MAQKWDDTAVKTLASEKLVIISPELSPCVANSMTEYKKD